MTFGGPEVLQIIEREAPRPGPGEAVVRVAAATVNPTDILMRAGKQAALMTDIKPPYVAGMDFAGAIEAVGPGVEGLPIGARVMGVVNPRRPAGGAHSEKVLAPVASLVPIPGGVELAEAATLPMNGLTAIMAIEALGLAKGSTVLVTGGAGALGGYVIQLARHAGLRVFADAKADDAALLMSFGAESILPRGDAMATALLDLAPQGVDGLVDCALLGAAAASLVRDGGVAVWVRKANAHEDPRLLSRYVGVTDRMTDTAALRRLATLAAEGALTPRVARRLPMEQAAEANRLVEAGGLRGRVVLTFG
jgi:NADPH:quinone reductase-like Zn-dependent oxidoreductase